jgi:hypothetical protein
MPRGMIETPAVQSNDTMSAPASADFYLNQGGMDKKPFVREKPNELVSLRSYDPYLIDPPEAVPIRLPFNNQGMFVHQHMYFREADYRQHRVPVENKNWGLVWVRNISYNQVIMRRTLELKLHKDHEDQVEPPPDETIADNLRDLAHVDLIGAAIIGKLIGLKPELKPTIVPSGSQLARRDEITPTERAEFFDGLLAKSVTELEKPLVTPQIVIASALKRMAVLLGHKGLENEADARLMEEETYYPLRMPKVERLYHLSNELLIHDADPHQLAMPQRMAA